MPKTEIDYSNTIIYKITCKNQTVTDLYVGHTTNFVQRKHAHKQSCINSKSTNHNCKLYEVIRANGGWANWQMEIINFFNCADHYEARKKEQEYFIELNATLNSIEPFPKPKVAVETENKIVSIKPIMQCNTCNIICNTLHAFNAHNNSNKHKQGVIGKSKMNPNENMPIKQNKPPKFICDKCDFKCSKQSNYDQHLLTNKHKKLTKPNIYNSKNAPEKYVCLSCKKIYKHASTLSAHKKKCKPIPLENTDPDMKMLANLMIEMMKSNTDLQKQMLEVCKIGNTNIHNNIHSNSHNKTFNLQFFLNETCKDAMNIMDFVNTMTLEFTDLEEVGKVGYVEGISNIIIRKLNALDVHKRPIHCSDSKREIMYVKDQNIWEKENSNYDKLRKAIKHVTCKNSSLLGPWSKEHPQCMNNQHHLNDVYVQMMGQAMGGKESFLESENKIMKKIAKAVLIDKA
jgi:hypothetical protein